MKIKNHMWLIGEYFVTKTHLFTAKTHQGPTEKLTNHQMMS
jgi:hypothetical protein